MAPLINAISLLTNLTSLGLYSEDYANDKSLPLLPAAASALTGLQQLDIDGRMMSPAVAALTGAYGFAGPASVQVHSSWLNSEASAGAIVSDGKEAHCADACRHA